MEGLLKIIELIEKYPVMGAAVLTVVGVSILAAIRWVISRYKKENMHVGPVFWSLGQKWKISAVLKREPSENSSGYTQSQYSRPDQWCKIIRVEDRLWGIRHEVTPNNRDDILVVNISRDGKEREKMISFNR